MKKRNPKREVPEMAKGESKFKSFLQRKNIVFSAKRYGIDALGAIGTFRLASDWYDN